MRKQKIENYMNDRYESYTKRELTQIEVALWDANAALNMADCLLNMFYDEYLETLSLDRLKLTATYSPEKVRQPILAVMHFIKEALSETEVFGDPAHPAVQAALHSAEQKKRIIKTQEEN